MKTIRATVTDERMILSPECGAGRGIIVRNSNPTQESIYVGDRNVSTETGFELKKNEQIAFNLTPQEDVYAIAGDEDSVLCSVFITGENAV